MYNPAKAESKTVHRIYVPVESLKLTEFTFRINQSYPAVIRWAPGSELLDGVWGPGLVIEFESHHAVWGD